MNAADLIDESLGLTDEADRDRIHAGLAADPEQTLLLSRLHESLSLLLDDGDDIEPPVDLAERTRQYVADQVRANQRRRLLELRPATVPFRWADVAMAAGIFLAGLVTLLPAIQRTRAQSRLAQCENNLRGIGVALNRYAAVNGHYPDPPADYPSGSYALMLKESGDLPADATLSCPCSGECAVHRSLTKYAGVRDLIAKKPQTLRDDFAGAYAYTAGYQTQGRPTPVPAISPSSATVPLLSDQPPHASSGTILDGNSPNHGGSGQNVLHADGHVGYFHNRFRSKQDPDIFLNQDHRPGPGLHPADSVLIPSAFSIKGR